MDCNDPILNKYIHVPMYIFLWEKLWKGIHQNVNSGYFWVGRILDNLKCLFCVFEFSDVSTMNMYYLCN